MNKMNDDIADDGIDFVAVAMDMEDDEAETMSWRKAIEIMSSDHSGVAIENFSRKIAKPISSKIEEMIHINNKDGVWRILHIVKGIECGAYNVGASDKTLSAIRETMIGAVGKSICDATAPIDNEAMLVAKEIRSIMTFIGDMEDLDIDKQKDDLEHTFASTPSVEEYIEA